MSEFVIEILDGDRAGTRIPLGDQPLKIGRRAENGLALADEKVSGVHAEVTAEGGRFVLRDLDSRNGTLLEGRPVDEVALTSGDVFQIGRVRLRFVPADEPAGAAGGGADLQVHRLGAEDLARARRSRSLLPLLGLLVVVALGVGAWWYLDQQGGPGGAGATNRHEPLVVRGNMLDDEVAQCESGAGWELQAGGDGFRAVGGGHTGTGALRAVPPFEAESLGWALARLAEGEDVIPGRGVTARAWMRTEGAGRVALRLRFRDEAGGGPFRFVTGSPLVARDGWQEVEVTGAVPPSTDRVEVELLAALPDGDAAAWVDDVALLPAEGAEPHELLLEWGQRLIGTGTALAVASVDETRPMVVTGVRPVVADAALAPIAEAGRLQLSDVGAAVEVGEADDGFHVTVSGGEAVALRGLLVDLPPGSLGGLLARGAGGPWREGGAPSEGVAEPAAALLLGAGATRCAVKLDEPVAYEARSRGGHDVLRLPVHPIELQVAFGNERQQARELLRRAEAAREARPGEALELVEELRATVPHDDEELRRARALVRDILDGLRARVDELQADADKAGFFRTRGGFVRVLRATANLRERYGTLPPAVEEKIAALEERARENIERIETERQQHHVERLRALADAFDEQGQASLAALVHDYLERHHGND